MQNNKELFCFARVLNSIQNLAFEHSSFKLMYYLAVKNDIRKFLDKWMELEKNNLNDVIQIQKDKHKMYYLKSKYYL